MDVTTHMIVAETDAMWDEYCKVNPEASKLKGRAFPLYNSWVEIFGNDRAQGTGAVDVGDIVHELLYGLSSKDLEKSSGNFTQTPTSVPLPKADKTFDESFSTMPPLAPKQQPISRVCTKCKQCNMITVDIEALVGKWMDNTSSTLGNLAKELAHPKFVQSTPSAESCLFDAISKISDLSLDEQIQASHYLTHNEADLRLFWGMHEQARARFIPFLGVAEDPTREHDPVSCVLRTLNERSRDFSLLLGR
ncbi:hypothetical protein CDL12_01373 [Handroanthus impetiginosus]|uniref:Uncharacterized protein n=1 Tax=Handroanthus impetiginosus TaxID=429701 RepID=A0A2G9I804_9LAMI|nr:hypothetical protein CDL12_01373 [Handroanthus impetiginosus]